jgi:hypothetical protein
VHTYPSSHKWPEAKRLFTHLLGDIHFHFRQREKECLSGKCPKFTTVEIPKLFLDRLIDVVQWLDVKAQCLDTREQPMEQAEVLQRVREEFGMSQKEIAEKIGFTEAHVSQRLTLLEAPLWMQEKVRRGEMKAGKAVAYVRQQKRGVS